MEKTYTKKDFIDTFLTMLEKSGKCKDTFFLAGFTGFIVGEIITSYENELITKEDRKDFIVRYNALCLKNDMPEVQRDMDCPENFLKE